MTTGAVSAHRLILRTLILTGAAIAAWAALTSAAHADTQPDLLTGLDGLVSTVADGTETPLPPPPAAKPPRPPAIAPHRGDHHRHRPSRPRPPKPRPPAAPTAPAVVGEAAATVHSITHQAGATVGKLVETVASAPPGLPPIPPVTLPGPPTENPPATVAPASPTPATATTPRPAPKPTPPSAATTVPLGPAPAAPTGVRSRIDHTAAAAPRPAYMDLCWPDWESAPEDSHQTEPVTAQDAAIPCGWTLSPPSTRAGPTISVDAAGRIPGSASPSG
jgi:hypothetical protein